MTTAVLNRKEHARRAALSLAGLVVMAVVLQLVFRGSEGFPAVLDKFLETPTDDAGAWLRANRRSHWLFTAFFAPLSSFINTVISSFEAFLQWMPWFVLIALVFYIPFRVQLWKQGLISAAVLAYCGLIGLWHESIQTLALMFTAVLLAVVIGIPLGMWGALRPRVERAMRPVLDAMQTVPAFVYFLPLFILLGIGNVPGAVATLIYALPPVVRLTTLGIKRVSPQAVEASRTYGATTWQTMYKVQLPMALPTVLTGLSQTIMMALGIVVLATLVGSAGLGSPVLQSLNQRRTGRGLAAGLAIVAIAMVLDRMWKAFAVTNPQQRVAKKMSWLVLGAIGVALAIGKAVGTSEFPEVWDWTIFDPLDNAVVWARDNLRWATRPFNDFIVANIYIPLREWLTSGIAWPVNLLITGWVGWKIGGWKLASSVTASVAVIGLIGMWELSIDTLVQVILATFVTLMIALPVGVWAGRRPKVESALGPVLDALQTTPSLVYIIPFVGYFGPGILPGILATVLYALVPGVRITALGIQRVAAESIEASRTFGATPRQTMYGVRIPLAAPTIMAAVNQVIMMVLAMVIITGLVGGGALGFETVRALTRSLFGLGLEVGIALVMMAMILDRLTEGIGKNLQPPEAPS